MIRKAIYGATAAAVLGGLVFGRDVFSYARTWGSGLREAVRAEVPLDFEVQRARKLVEELVPDIRHCMHTIAEQQVELEDLNRQIAQKSEALQKQQEAILALKADLETGKTTFVYASANRAYTADEVRRDLTRRFERFKVAQATVDRERQILKAKQTALQANQKKLEELLNSKQDLEVQIAELEARLKSVQAVETVSALRIDDSRLSRAKQLIHELNKQIDVKEKLLATEGTWTGEIPVETDLEPAADITVQIDEYFGTPAGPGSPAVAHVP